MKPSTFASLLQRRSLVDETLVTPYSTLTAGELVERASALREARAEGSQALVAQSGNTEDFLLSLLAFDGFCRVLLCLPQGEPVPAAWNVRLESQLNRLPATTSQTHWVLSTSGTTGTPKLVAHTLESLTSTTKLDVQAGAAMRWGLVYDPARFAGLQLVLQALLGGGVLVVPPQESLAVQLAFMAKHGVNALSATPSLWRKILMTSGAEAGDAGRRDRRSVDSRCHSPLLSISAGGTHLCVHGGRGRVFGQGWPDGFPAAVSGAWVPSRHRTSRARRRHIAH